MVKAYVVFVGIAPGIYNSWDTCKPQVDGFPNAVNCKFHDQKDALAAFEKFNFEKKWFSQNPVKACPRCAQIMECEISNTKGSCGQHNFVCKDINCGYSILAHLIPITIRQQQQHIVEDKLATTSNSGKDSKDYENICSSFKKDVGLG